MTMPEPTAFDPVHIGLVSASDRASAGVYADQGIPALQEWLAGAITTPFRVETRLPRLASGTVWSISASRLSTPTAFSISAISAGDGPIWRRFAKSSGV